MLRKNLGANVTMHIVLSDECFASSNLVHIISTKVVEGYRKGYFSS